MPQPNVLWICTDSQRWDTLGCYGNEFVDTPAVDRLAGEGLRFERCFSQSPICAPARASFLTGRYPVTTKLRKNGQEIPESERLITRVLADEGYTCGLAGKLHLGPCEPFGRIEDRTDPYVEPRIDDGYAEFEWSHDPSEAWPTNAYTTWLHDRGIDYDLPPPDSGTGLLRPGVPAEHHQSTWCGERAVSFIERYADVDGPWLFSVNPFDPHYPFDPPESHLEPYLDRLEEIPLPEHVATVPDRATDARPDDGESDELAEKPAVQRHKAEETDGMTPEEHRHCRAAYWAMCDLIDEAVAEMLAALERTGQRENTLVIFTSDHGELLGDHGMYRKGPFFYEGAIRVPLVISGPGIEAGVEREALVELSDLAPTILDACGVEHPPGMQARSFWSLLADGECGTESVKDHHREGVYCEYYDGLVDPVSTYATMVRTDSHKLVRIHGDEPGELYHLEADPEETENLWDDREHRDVKTELLARLADRMADTVDPLPPRRGYY